MRVIDWRDHDPRLSIFQKEGAQIAYEGPFQITVMQMKPPPKFWIGGFLENGGPRSEFRDDVEGPPGKWHWQIDIYRPRPDHAGVSAVERIAALTKPLHPPSAFTHMGGEATTREEAKRWAESLVDFAQEILNLTTENHDDAKNT